MKQNLKYLAGAAIIALSWPAMGQTVTSICVKGTNSSNGGNSCTPVTSSYPLPVTGSISATNPSVSTNGAAAPTSSTQIGIRDAGGNLQPASATNPVPVTGSFSASIAGFTPTIPAATAALAVTAASSAVALPTGTSVKVQNIGASPAHVRLSVGSGTAVTTDDVIQPGAAVYATVGTGTFLDAIADAGNATNLQITGGAGLGSSYSGSGLPQTYNLLTNATVTGSTITNLTGGTYLADLRGTVGGASIAVQVTGADGNFVTFTTLTSAGSTGPFSIGAGSSVKAVVSGGSPTGLYLALEGIGAGSSSSGASGVAQGSTTSGQLGSLVQGAVTTASPTYTTAQTSPLSLDTTGSLRVNVTAGGAGGGAVYGPTAVGSAAANPPVLMAGTANAGATGAVQVVKVDSSGNASVNVANNGLAVGASTTSQNYSLIGTNNGSSTLVPVIQADSSAAINVSTATTTQLVALSSGKKIYVTAWDVVAAGTGNITLEYGTGSSCGTGTTVLTGAYNLTAQSGIAKGNGIGPVLVIPASNALCALTSAAVQMSGSVAYTQQ